MPLPFYVLPVINGICKCRDINSVVSSSRLWETKKGQRSQQVKHMVLSLLPFSGPNICSAALTLQTDALSPRAGNIVIVCGFPMPTVLLFVEFNVELEQVGNLPLCFFLKITNASTWGWRCSVIYLLSSPSLPHTLSSS